MAKDSTVQSKCEENRCFPRPRSRFRQRIPITRLPRRGQLTLHRALRRPRLSHRTRRRRGPGNRPRRRGALQHFGRVDTLINNGGIWRTAPITDISEGLYRRVIATNLDSVFFATQAAVTAMKQQGSGHILQISTSLVEHALSTVLAVLASMSKGAAVAATRGLAMELAPHNIRVNTVSLAIINTPLHDTAAHTPPPLRVAAYRRRPAAAATRPPHLPQLTKFSKSHFHVQLDIERTFGMRIGHKI
jgi:NAD(P)-dependent dehydrogenase (short-subunit alcohol dehydrogenase family)